MGDGPGLHSGLLRLAVLPKHGVVIASSRRKPGLLYVLRISDGVLLAESSAPHFVTYLAADPLTGVVYASPAVGCNQPFVDVSG